MKKEEKRVLFDNLNKRPGVSERILEIAKEIVDTDSFKRAIIGAGQIRLLAEISEADSYWDEKMSTGYEYERRICNGCRKVTFDAHGNAKDKV